MKKWLIGLFLFLAVGYGVVQGSYVFAPRKGSVVLPFTTTVWVSSLEWPIGQTIFTVISRNPPLEHKVNIIRFESLEDRFFWKRKRVKVRDDLIMKVTVTERYFWQDGFSDL